MKKNFLILLVTLNAVIFIWGDTPPLEKDFKLTPILLGLNYPWAVAFFNNGGGLVTQRGGDLLFFSNKGEVSKISGVPSVVSEGQGGLLDLILDSDFDTNSRIYFSFSQGINGQVVTSVATGQLNFATYSLDYVKIIHTGNNSAQGYNHFGSRLTFDSMGNLLVTVGERNKRELAQDLNNTGGSVIRIRLNKEFTNTSYTIFSYGHRNPQGLAVHPKTKDIWLTEHGPRGGDELNLIKQGLNYGWPVITHGLEYSGQKVGQGLKEAPNMEQPIYYWTPSIAPSGMAWYMGEEFPLWEGDLFIGALAGKKLVRLKLDLNTKSVIQEDNYLVGWNRIRDVRTDRDGKLYLLTDGNNAGLWRIDKK